MSTKSNFTCYTDEVTGRLLIKRKNSKYLMVLDGYERRCFLQVLSRVHSEMREEALESIWRALEIRASEGKRDYISSTRH